MKAYPSQEANGTGKVRVIGDHVCEHNEAKY